MHVFHSPTPRYVPATVYHNWYYPHFTTYLTMLNLFIISSPLLWCMCYPQVSTKSDIINDLPVKESYSEMGSMCVLLYLHELRQILTPSFVSIAMIHRYDWYASLYRKLTFALKYRLYIDSTRSDTIGSFPVKENDNQNMDYIRATLSK